MSIIYSSSNLINSINILQWNVRSLPAHLLSLQHIFSYNKCSIAFLSETWLLPSCSISISNYVSLRSDRHDGYGGAAIAIHNSLKLRLIPFDTSIENDLSNFKIDIVDSEVLLPNTSSSLMLWSCFIPSNINIPANI